MTSSPVSVVIPTYNRSKLVSRAIRSALAAISPQDEIVVVDDGSTDDTVAVVESFGPQVRLLRASHEGAGPARNAGLAAARGPLVAFLDSDDEWFPDKIALQRAFFERRPDVMYAFSDFGVRREDGSEERRYLRHWLRAKRRLSEVFDGGIRYSSLAPLPAGREDFRVHVGSLYLEEMRNNLVPTFTLMVRKEETEGALRFADDLPTCEEWPAFGRLARSGPGAFFETETAWQHGHSGPRLTGTPGHVWADAWLSTLDRVWGSDPEFLAAHGDEYRHVVSDAHLMRVGSLARHGRLNDARLALRQAGSGSIALGAIALLAALRDIL